MDDHDLIVKVAEHTEQLKVMNHRVSDLEEIAKKIEDLSINIGQMTVSIEQIIKELADSKAKQADFAEQILQLQMSPIKAKAERHDKYMGQIMTLVIGLLFGVIVNRLFGL